MTITLLKIAFFTQKKILQFSREYFLLLERKENIFQLFEHFFHFITTPYLEVLHIISEFKKTEFVCIVLR